MSTSTQTNEDTRLTRHERMVLISTGLAVFAVFLDTTILFVAFNAISADFPNVSAASLSWVLNAYTIVFAATLIPAGRLADRIGRRKTFLYAVIGFTAASMLCGLAPSAPWLIAARMLQALGAAAMVPASLALILQSFPKPKVSTAIAIWSAVGAAAGAIGPTLGALVIEHLGWRWAFYVNLPVGVFSFVLARRVLSESREQNAGRFPDAVGIVLLMLALAAMAYSVVKTSEWGWLSVNFIGVFAASIVLVLAFIVRCARVPNPLFDLTLFQSPTYRLANIAMLLYASGFSAMFLGNIIFLTKVWGYSTLRAGLAVSLGPVIVTCTAPYLGRVAARIGQRALLIPGGLVWAAAGAFLLLRTGTQPHYLSQFLPVMPLTAFGVALILPQLSSVSMQGLPANSFGAGSAINQSARNLGSTLGVALVIAFVHDAHGDNAVASFHALWWFLVAIGFCVTALSLLLPRPVTMIAPVISAHAAAR